MTTEFYIKEVTWSTHEPALKLIREQVFITEQQVPEALEWDEHDIDATHWLALDDEQQAVGCARLLDNGTIGRMAVVKTWRGKGVGSALLNAIVTRCQQSGLRVIKLSAQVHAIPFYEQAGFVVTSDPYLDANIPHVDMQLNIQVT